MKRIPLTQGKFAIVDDEDYRHLIQWKWYLYRAGNKQYAVRNISWRSNTGMLKRRIIRMHRVIMHPPKNRYIDHINHNGIDNRKSNMRNCTSRENQGNRLVSNHCSSKYKGVNRHDGKWQARIGYKYKQLYIGFYDTEIEAAEAYNQKAIEIFGEFAKVNQIREV